jgi:hypothetical protein
MKMGLGHSPSVVTSGLVLALDAGNTKSYPGSGTTWTDLSGNGNTGTLTNGPTYSSSNGGTIVFDGTDDYISTSSNQNLLPTAGLSICAWIKSSVADKWGVDKAPSAGGQGYIFAGNSLSTWGMNVNSASVLSASTYTSNTWKFIVGTWTPSSNLMIYFNGVLDAISTTSIPATITDPSVNLWIARRRSGGDYFNGSIANVSIYSVALTADQVLQNYNALRGRFGL